MKLSTIMIVVIVTSLITIGLFNIYDVTAAKDKSYRHFVSFCQELTETSTTNSIWSFVIYLDIEACITCTDHIQSWTELEQLLPQYGGRLYIFTNSKDSADVAIAMKLEGLGTKVRILSQETIEHLGLFNRRTPFKILFDKDCRPTVIKEPFESKNEAELFYRKLMAAIVLENDK